MSTGRDARRYLPPIFDLARLFPGLKGTDGTENSEDIRKRAGFSFGSRILITGEAGTGKTTFVLAMVRALMSQWSTDLTRRTVAHATYDQSRHFAPTKDGGEAYGATNHELCFLSPEIDGDRLKHLFAQYGWFTDHDPLFNPTTKSGIAQGRTCFIPKISEARIRLPPHGSGDLVDLVIKEVKDRYSRLPPGHDVFVVVDSITAILKDSRDAGERRRDLLLFLDRLEDALRPSYPALMFLIAERPEQPDPVTLADEVAADFVFHLGISRTSPGRWLRTLSVANAQSIRRIRLAAPRSTGHAYGRLPLPGHRPQ